MHARYEVPDLVVQEGINEFDDLTRIPTKWTLNNIWDSHCLFPSREVYISNYCFWTSSWKLWRILLQNTWNTQTIRLNIVIFQGLLSTPCVSKTCLLRKVYPQDLDASKALGSWNMPEIQNKVANSYGWSTGAPPNVLPLRNKGLIAGFLKGNQWLRSTWRTPYFWAGVR